jgi:hypothetical protein
MRAIRIDKSFRVKDGKIERDPNRGSVSDRLKRKGSKRIRHGKKSP